MGRYPVLESKLPLRIRTVGILHAGAIKDGAFAPEDTFNEGELRRVEVELAKSISNDMLKMGFFRSPQPGEKPYLLDVEFPELSVRVCAGCTSLLGIAGGLTLGAMYLLGMPSVIFIHKGEAVFKLYSPEEILVHETVIYKEKSHAIGIYYGHMQSFGKIIAILLNKLKLDIFERIDTILANTPVASIYGNFRRKDPYNLMANQIIMNSGPAQLNYIDSSKSIHIEQKPNNPIHKNASRKKGGSM